MALLERAGYRLVLDPGEADVALVNTCAFIEAAQRESIERILELAALKGTGPLRVLLVTGCLAERHGAELLREIPEIDGLLGPGRCARVAGVTRGLLDGGGPRVLVGGLQLRPAWGPRAPTGSPHVAYVKIAEGCSHACHFCLIPRLRGPQRSRPAGQIVAEVARLGEEGVREVILVAQDTTAYGRDLAQGGNLAALLRRLNNLAAPEWIRLLYTHPQRWNEELIDLFAAGGRVLPYVDLPVQHASDRVLEAMGRGRTGRRVRELITRLRARIPGVILRATIMTGHPGEGEREFSELIRFLREFPFDRLGAFAYSPEPETRAAAASGRPAGRVARERRARVLALQKGIALERQRTREGQSCVVLIDGVQPGKGRWLARSYGEAPDIDGVIRVRASGQGETVEPGEFRRVRIVKAGPYDFWAVPEEKPRRLPGPRGPRGTRKEAG